MSGQESSTKRYGPWATKYAGCAPQHYMHKHYLQKADPSLRFIAEDNPYNSNGKTIFARQYWLMNAEGLEDIVRRNERSGIQNCFYELMPSSCCTYSDASGACEAQLKAFGTRAYLDVEFREPCDWVDHGTSELEPLAVGVKIAKMFRQHLETMLRCDCHLMILKSHRRNKKSWHMVAKCFRDGVEHLFKDSLAVLTVMQAWDKTADLKIFDYYEGDSLKNAIDSSVYSTHKLFRIYRNQKKASNSGILQWGGYYPAKDEAEPAFQDTLVLQPYENRLQFETLSSQSTTKFQRQVVEKRCTTKATRKRPRKQFHGHLALEQFFFNLPVWAEVKSFLEKRFRDADFNSLQFKTIDTVYMPLNSTKCPFNNGSDGGMHKTNHSYLYVYLSSGCCFWFCQDQDCKGKKRQVDFPLDLKMKMRSLFQRKKEITVRV